ncbi:MAG TPA: family 1 encapsulin nanocompartment shell protein, partial [Nakamurella sp.]
MTGRPQTDEEAARTIKRNLAGRRVIDVSGPLGYGFAAVTTGHVAEIATPADGVQARLPGILPLVEVRVPFTLERSAVDDVARGSQDSDWQPVKDAATAIAHSEDRAVFEGYP